MSQFLLPDLGEGLEDAQLVEWLVHEGETVALNQPLCQVETAKALVDIPSPYAGRVEKLHAAPGETVLVGRPLITIATAAVTSAASEGQGPMLVGYGTAGPAPALARRRRVPSGAAPTPPAPAAAAPNGDPSAVAASPLVRKMAADLGVDLATVRGTGPGGRVRVEDLQAARAATNGRVTPASPAPASVAPAAVADEPGDRRISTVGLRKAIAAQMVRSASTIPQFIEYGQFDATALVALRDRLRADAALNLPRLTFLPLFVRALVLAVREYPIMNSRWDDEGNAIIVRGAINVGIATDTERGLIVPVIHHAEGKGLPAIAAESAHLVEQARAGKLGAALLTGGSITLTNVGGAGPVDMGAPLINPPEACVVGLGAIKPRPTVVGDAVLVRPGAWISMSCDHRIVDGVVAARFLGALVRLLEAPEALVAPA